MRIQLHISVWQFLNKYAGDKIKYNKYTILFRPPRCTYINATLRYKGLKSKLISKWRIFFKRLNYFATVYTDNFAKQFNPNKYLFKESQIWPGVLRISR